jgi:hypothetical protein
MIIQDALIHFIKNFYVIEYRVSTTGYGEDQIIIRDVYEPTKVTGNIIPITLHRNVNVTFLWNNSKKLTEVDLYQKDINELPGRIMKIFRDKRTMEFYEFLQEERIDIVIPICDIPEEFPLLFV